ncbi:hypothetical protein OEZ85_004918 [Tetradesmus obliquus]|uniref:GCK domain-containing protein n=1 Tax=Tetradesmus obliquus TaxID=3088 RepID=A0ABY8ULP7_TETOB|nr:hypothetical protein OEZ85_004918 [Tetradesmus obliquus]
MSAKQEPESTQTAEVLANAAAEASKPGADTESQYECPFCVMMRKGGCEEVFKAFMDCGEKADKGDSEMADCLPQFEQLHLCMEKNKAVFDNLLQEMKEEEALNKAAASASSRSASGGADKLPKERAPPNSPWGYVKCDYSCMTNFASSVKAGSATKGVFELVRFKPLAGVTRNMMVWLLNNDHKNVNFTDSTGKTRVMPMHLLFHPVDHMFHTSSSTPMTVGSKLVRCEIPLTGCRYDLKSNTEPWVCPTNRTGFLQSTPKSTWGKFMQTKGSATNVPANNMTSIGHMAALHFLQEYGTLPRWLPKVYNNRQK